FSFLPALLSAPPHPPSTRTLSLHDALPIFPADQRTKVLAGLPLAAGNVFLEDDWTRAKPLLAGHLRELGYAEATVTGEAQIDVRSEEHTSELQSLRHLVCRLLLEKKKKPIA